MTFQPDQRPGLQSTVTIEMVPGTTLAQTQAVVDQVAALLQQAAARSTTSMRAPFVGNGRVTAIFKPNKDRNDQRRVRARAGAAAGSDPRRARRRSARRSGWGIERPRHHRSCSAATIPSCSTQTAQQARRADGAAAERRRAAHRGRPAAARDRDQAALRSRRRPRRDDRRRCPARSASRRWATSTRTAPNSRCRDRQIPIRVALDENRAAANCRRSRTCRCRPRAAARCRCSVVADIGFGAGPTQIERINQQRRIAVGADLAPGVGQRRRAASKIDELPIDEEPAAGRAASCTLGQAKWQAEMVNNFIIAVVVGRACWCSRCWCCSTAASCRRSSTWARCCSRRSAALIALLDRRPCRSRCRSLSAC